MIRPHPQDKRFMQVLAAFMGLAAASCRGGSPGENPPTPASSDPAVTEDAATGNQHSDAGGTDGVGDGVDATGPGPVTPTNKGWQFRTQIITKEHRAIPGVMFGGWGPHLGHFVRTKDDLYWVDDACAPGACNVNVDSRVDYWKIGATSVDRVASVALPGGVQQNTGTVASSDTIWTYGIAVTGKYLMECAYIPTKTSPACNALPVEIGTFANYVGAAIDKGGSRIAWLTNVGDGGNGSFRFYANYGAGWNGPRTGSINGYNDASYIDIGFLDQGRFTMSAELVSGVAPNWTFTGGVGEGNLGSANAVTWSVAPSLPGDPTLSTADIRVDPTYGDTHVLVRSKSGALVYLHRSKTGAWSPAVVAAKVGFRARFVATGGRVFVAHDVAGQGVVVREFARAEGPLDWTKSVAVPVPLPPGYESIYAIYPETDAYQTTPVGGVNIALVGNARENEVLGVFATPP